MTDHPTLGSLYEGWARYQTLLTEALAPLTSEQLALQAAPHLRPVWLIAAHIISARVYWFHRVLGEGDAALAPWQTGDDPGQPVRSAPELIEGLNATWLMIQESLDQWTAADRDATFLTRRGTARTRGWVVWHVLEHDLHHGGELCLTLGMHGIATPDL
jgi:uncharacterized damage-inducible protein DinB